MPISCQLSASQPCRGDFCPSVMIPVASAVCCGPEFVGSPEWRLLRLSLCFPQLAFPLPVIRSAADMQTGLQEKPLLRQLQ